MGGMPERLHARTDQDAGDDAHPASKVGQPASAEPVSTEPAPAEQSTLESSPDAVPPARRSNYELPNRTNTSLRNMLWALGVTMGLVVLVGIGFFGVGSDLQREVPEESQLDVAESAQRAQENAPFTIAVPQLDSGWQANSARFGGGEAARWEVRYSSPSRDLVTLVQESEVSPALLSAALPGAVVEGERQLAGVDCDVLRSGTGEDPLRGVSCQTETSGVLVHGEGPAAELEDLAAAALESMEDGSGD